MPVKVAGAPIVGLLMVLGGLWEHMPIVVVAGIVLMFIGLRAWARA